MDIPQPKAGQNGVLSAMLSLGVPAALYALFDSIFDATEKVYYHAGLLVLAVLIAALSSPGISRRLRQFCSIVAALLATYLMGSAYVSYTDRMIRSSRIKALASPLTMKLETRSLPSGDFAPILSLKNELSDSVEIYSYSAQNEHFGYFRDVKPGTLIIAPGETRTVSLGGFPW